MPSTLHNIANSDFFSSALTIFITCNFILLLYYALLNYRSIVQTLKISGKTLTLLFLIFLLALSLRLYLPPFIHDDFYNEWEYMEAAQSMILNGKYTNCAFGDQYECFQTVIPKHSPGVPLILSIPFALFGATDGVAFNTNIFFGSTSVALIFLVGYLLSNRESIGLYSAFFFSLIPIHIKLSGTVLLGPISVFFQLLTAVSFLISLRVNSKKMWFLFFVTLAYTLQTRPETMVLLVLFISGYFLIKPGTLGKVNLSRYHFLVIILLLPHMTHMVNGMTKDSWMSEHEPMTFSLNYAMRNLIPYTTFWFNTNYQLIIYPFLSLIGSFYLLKENRKVFCFLILWIAVFIGIYSLFQVDPVTSYTSFRYMLSGYTPFCLLMAFGSSLLSDKFSYSRIIIVVLSLVSLYPLIPYISNVQIPRQIEVEIMKEVEGEIDDNCYVIGQPSLFSIHKKIIYPDLLLRDQNIYNSLKNITDCLYLYKDLSAMNDDWPEKVLSKFPGEIMASRDVQLIDGSTFTFAFYRLDMDKYPE